MELKPFHLTTDGLFESPYIPKKKACAKEMPINPFHARKRVYLDRHFFMALIGLFLLSAVIASGILREFANPAGLLTAKRYAFVQVRAIDENGAAIQGAQVLIDKKPNGYTDSFGYWQRYMRVQLGGDLNVTLSKQYPTHTIVGERSVKVDRNQNENKELELKTSVIMKSGVAVGARTVSAADDDVASEL